MKKLVFALVAVAASAVVAGEFKAGFARVDITPPLGNFMPGYYVDRFAKEVLDPLQINMVAFSDGKTTALVAQYDTEALSDMVADRMRDAIVKATGGVGSEGELRFEVVYEGRLGQFWCDRISTASDDMDVARLETQARLVRLLAFMRKEAAK